ncbi:MAG: hypothetical protein WAK41_16485 [Roseiarcus sp.]
MKIAIDDLPSVSVSRLRALGEITAQTKVTSVGFGEVSFNVALSLRRFPNGGSWSFFLCPCGRRARVLRLFEGGLACRQCLGARGLRPRVQLIRTEKRASYLAPKRLERLNSTTPARIHPRPGRMLDRRANLEIALRRSLIVARGHRAAEAKKAGI